ncbi:MAG: 50S ribosomal protein L6 [bacterium]|nr:50S ribosomal protein L6 [bacterium]
MSRIGKKPIIVPPGVTVQIQDGEILVKGNKGDDKLKLNPAVSVVLENGELIVSVKNKTDKKERALWGLFRALLMGRVVGVNEGYEKKLEMQGVGFKANLEGKKLVLEVGFSHPVEIILPEGIEVKVEKNIISVKGINKEAVGAFTAYVRSVYEPEPYQGKGIRYVGEIVRRKAGKAAKTAGAGAGK